MTRKSGVSALLERVPLSDGAACELVALRRKMRSVGRAEQRPSLESHSETEALCLRYIDRGSQALLTTTDVRPDSIPDLAQHAREIAGVSPQDPHRRLAAPKVEFPPAPEADPRLFTVPSDEIQEKLRDVEEKVLKADPRLKKVVKFHYAEERTETDLVNSLGVDLTKEQTRVSFMAEILAVEGGETEVAWDFQASRFSKDVNVAEVAERVAAHAVRSLGAGPVPSGRYAVVVHPRVGTQLLHLIAEALSAEAVHLGRSFLAGWKGRRIASPLVTLVDDPLLAGGLRSAAFDDEGTPHRSVTAVREGNLEDYFTDVRSASRDRRESNGHGLKESLAAAPSPHPTNFFLKPGVSSVDGLLSAEPVVFHLLDVMGLHMADPVTGEFSLGASGALYERGRFTRSVRGVTVAGTLRECFDKVAAVAEDLTWYGDVGAPSFLVSDVSVSGN